MRPSSIVLTLTDIHRQAKPLPNCQSCQGLVTIKPMSSILQSPKTILNLSKLDRNFSCVPAPRNMHAMQDFSSLLDQAMIPSLQIFFVSNVYKARRSPASVSARYIAYKKMIESQYFHFDLISRVMAKSETQGYSSGLLLSHATFTKDETTWYMRIAVISYYTARSLYLPAPVYLNSHFGSSCKFTYKQDLCQKKHRRNVSFGSTSLTFVSNYGSSRVINRSSRGAFASNIKQKQAKKKNEYTAHEVRKLHNIIASTT